VASLTDSFIFARPKETSASPVLGVFDGAGRGMDINEQFSLLSSSFLVEIFLIH